MSDKSYSIDDILQEIRDNKISKDTLEKTADEYKKFDTQALLDDILGKSSDSISLEKEVANDNSKSESTEKSDSNTYNNDTDIHANAAVIQDENEASLVPDAVDEADSKAVVTESRTANEQIKDNSADAQDEDQKYDTRQLKYMALKKTRQQLVEDFVLNKEEITKDKEPDNENSYSDTYEIKTTQQFNAIDNTPNGTEPSDNEIKKAVYPSQKTRQDFAKEWSKKETAEQNDISPTDWPDYLDEYKSYEQTDETLTFLNELKHKNMFKTVVMTVLFILSIAIIAIGKFVSPHPMPIIDPEQNPVTFCLVNLILCLVVMFVNAGVISNGIVSTFKRKPNKDALYSYAIVAMTIFNLVILTSSSAINETDVFLYTPALIFIALLASLGKSYAIKRIITNFRFVSGQYDKYSVGVLRQNELAKNLSKGSLYEDANILYNKKAAFLSDFIKESLRDDLSDEISVIMAPLAGIMSLVAGLITFILGNDIYVALTVFTGVLIVSAGCVTMFISNYPLYSVSKTLSRLGGGVLGYEAAKSFSDANCVVVPAKDLFFDRNIILYGIKTFSEMPIDRAILDATSVLKETNSILSGMFMKIISDREDILDPVDSVMYEDAMGISAWVNHRRVLIGSRELMINHNIDIPSKDYEDRYIAQGKNLIYLSAEGVLSAVFVVGLKYSEEIRNMLIDLYNNNILVMVKTVDPILTEARLGEVFDLPEATFKVIPSRLHKELEEYTAEAESASGAVFNNGKLPAYLYSFLFAKNLSKPLLAGKLISFASTILGILLFVVFTLLNSTSQLTNEILCFYEILSLAVCLFVQRVTMFRS